MANNFKEKRFATKKSVDNRKENIRTERLVEGELPKVVFSFKDFDKSQIPPGQTYEDWQDKGYLAYLLEKLSHISELNMIEAKQQKYITEYGTFPKQSDFKHPRHIAEDVNWAVIKKIKGQKGRVAGHIIGNVFYIVFLDLDHLFWKMDK
jgi:hypothetical protein